MRNNIYKNLTGLFLLIITHSGAFAQKDTLTYQPGISIGYNLLGSAMKIYYPEYTNYEFSIDYTTPNKFIFIVEAGSSSTNFDNDKLKYSQSGIYGKLGMDYNLLKKVDPDDNNILSVGARYCHSSFGYDGKYSIENPYWGDETIIADRQSVNVNWMELVASVRVELFFLKNVFLGWSARGKIILSKSETENFNYYSIPGYEMDKLPIGLTWSVFYKIAY